MKKTKKLLVVLLTMLMMMASFSIVASAGTVPVGTWSVKVVVDGVSHTVTSADVSKLTVYTVKAGYVNKTGTTVSNEYTGVRLNDLLKSIGVTDVTTVGGAGSDGYPMSPDYTKAIAMSNNTLLAWGKDGATMDSGHLPMLIPGDSTESSQFLKTAATITVTGATLAKTTSTSTSSSSTATSSSTSNPKTGDSSPVVPAEILLFAAVSMLAVMTTMGLKKSFNRK